MNCRLAPSLSPSLHTQRQYRLHLIRRRSLFHCNAPAHKKKQDICSASDGVDNRPKNTHSDSKTIQECRVRLREPSFCEKSIQMTLGITLQKNHVPWESHFKRITYHGNHTSKESRTMGTTLQKNHLAWESHFKRITYHGNHTSKESRTMGITLQKNHVPWEPHFKRITYHGNHTSKESPSMGITLQKNHVPWESHFKRIT